MNFGRFFSSRQGVLTLTGECIPLLLILLAVLLPFTLTLSTHTHSHSHAHNIHTHSQSHSHTRSHTHTFTLPLTHIHNFILSHSDMHSRAPTNFTHAHIYTSIQTLTRSRTLTLRTFLDSGTLLDSGTTLRKIHFLGATSCTTYSVPAFLAPLLHTRQCSPLLGTTFCIT